MRQSRLERVRSKRAGKQGIVYLLLALILMIVTAIWGLPGIAKLMGSMIRSEDSLYNSNELRPTPPIFSDIPEATYSAHVRIAGYAQPGLEVLLYLNDSEYERKLVSESGTFVFDRVKLSEGETTAYAYSLTAHELRSEQSKAYTIVLDTTKPKVEIINPSEGEIFRGMSQRIANFEGSVDEVGAKVYIGERMAIVGSEGKFSLAYQLVEGDQEINIIAIDKAGNESTRVIKLRWEP